MLDLNRLADPKAYTNEIEQYEIFRELRRNSPVRWMEIPGFRPFWAVSKAVDIQFIESSSDKFLAGPRTVLLPQAVEAENLRTMGYTGGVRAITHMDGARHRDYRNLTREYFSPRQIKLLEEQIILTAKYFVDQLQARSGDVVDFAADIAFWYPLRVILQLLGVPRDDEPAILRMTQALFGHQDAEFGDSSVSPEAKLGKAVMELNEYFAAMTADRRAHPRDDIATILANATINGRALDPVNLLSYFIIVATAGHDTTSATIAGGFKALIENPDQWRRLIENPDLQSQATNEMIRWVAPVKHFMRTAACDIEVGGQMIQTEDAVMLLFASGCRDEDVFVNPDKFIIDREPNKHLAFGFGPHLCLGMHLARLEISAFFRELLPRVRKAEIVGTPEYMEAVFVSGLKRLPIRIEMQ